MSAGASGKGGKGMGQLELPASIAANNRLELVIPIIEPIRSVGIFRAALARDDGPDIQAIDRVSGQVHVNEFGDGGKQVDSHEHVFAFGAGRDFAGPAHDARLARAAFPASAFALAQGISRAGMITVAKPGAVVGSENEPGFLFEPGPLESIHHPANGPVNLLDDIAIKAAFAFAAELVADVQRHMRHVVSEVQEEGLGLVLLDKLHRPLGVPGRELVLIFMRDLGDSDFIAFEHDEVRVTALSPLERIRQFHEVGVERPHIVRVRQAKVFVEPVPERKELRGITQMPLAEDRGGITALFDKLREGHFIGAYPDLRARSQCAMDADAVGVTARQQGGARGGTYWLGDMEIAKNATLRRELIEVGRFETPGSEHAYIRVALIVCENDHDVRQGPGFGREGVGRKEREQRASQRQEFEQAVPGAGHQVWRGGRQGS